MRRRRCEFESQIAGMFERKKERERPIKKEKEREKENRVVANRGGNVGAKSLLHPSQRVTCH